MDSANERDQVADHLQVMAEELFLKGDYAKAESLFLRLLSDYKGSIDSWNVSHWLGMCYYYQNRIDEATVELEKARAGMAEQNNSLAYALILNYLGICYWCKDDYDRALEYFETGHEYDNLLTEEGRILEKYEFSLMWGRVLMWVGRWNEAIEKFERAEKCLEKMEPGRDREHYANVVKYEKGRTYYYAGNQQMAGLFLEKVKGNKLDKDLIPDYHSVMIGHNDWAKKYSKVIRHYEQLSKLEMPEKMKGRLYNAVGRAYYNLGLYSESLEFFNKSLQYPADAEWVTKSNEEYLKALMKIYPNRAESSGPRPPE